MSKGIYTTTHAMIDVVDERVRQITKEGYSPAHDDAHLNGELAKAASVYASVAAICTKESMEIPPCFRPKDWPLDLASFKKSTPRRMLVKAAALILAEIDRIDRLDGRSATPFRPHQ